MLSFTSGAETHAQTLVMSAHFTVISVASLAMIVELCNTTEISNISIWQYKKICSNIMVKEIRKQN